MSSIKLTCFFALCLFYFGCFCFKTPKVEPFSNKCIVCDSILFEQKVLQIPKRKVDINLTGIPLLKKEGSVAIPDSAMVLTSKESRNVYNTLFCFLGKKVHEVDSYFSSLDNFKSDLYNSNKFIKSYYYNLGDYFQNGRIVDHIDGADLEFKITHLTKFDLIFSKIGNDTLFTGTKIDSINLMNCRKVNSNK